VNELQCLVISVKGFRVGTTERMLRRFATRISYNVACVGSVRDKDRFVQIGMLKRCITLIAKRE
jgi:hypothetical protein